MTPLSPMVRLYTDALTPIDGITSDMPVPSAGPGPESVGSTGPAWPPPPVPPPPPPPPEGAASVACRPADAGVSVGTGVAAAVGAGVTEGASVATRADSFAEEEPPLMANPMPAAASARMTTGTPTIRPRLSELASRQNALSASVRMRSPKLLHPPPDPRQAGPATLFGELLTPSVPRRSGDYCNVPPRTGRRR